MTSLRPAPLPPLLAVLLLLASMSLTGANVPFGKAIATALPIYAFIAFRFLLATAALVLLVRLEPGRALAAMTLPEAARMAAMALFGSVLFTAFLLEGTRRTSAAEAGIIMATLPAVATALGLALRRERPSLRQSLAVLLAVLGLAVVQGLGSGEGGPGGSLAGNALVGLAVLCEASFVLLSARMSLAFRPIRLSLGVSAMSLALSLPLAVSQISTLNPATVPAGLWLLAVWYAMTSSVLCTVLWYRGAPHVPTWLAGLATAALPVSALAVSALWLGEPIGPFRLAGAALVVAAIAIGAMPGRSH